MSFSVEALANWSASPNKSFAIAKEEPLMRLPIQHSPIPRYATFTPLLSDSRSGVYASAICRQNANCSPNQNDVNAPVTQSFCCNNLQGGAWQANAASPCMPCWAAANVPPAGAGPVLVGSQIIGGHR